MAALSVYRSLWRRRIVSSLRSAADHALSTDDLADITSILSQIAEAQAQWDEDLDLREYRDTLESARLRLALAGKR